jgi:hypothetical protein
MDLRRTALATSVLLAAMSPSAHAAGTKPLDGKRRTHVRYTADLQDPAIGTGTGRLGTDLLDPTIDDCTKTSCDVTRLSLTLPRDVSGGVFSVSLTIARELNVYVALYDAKGGIVHAEHAVDPQNSDDCCSDYLPVADNTDATYVVDFTIARLRAGHYTFVVYDRGGAGRVTTDVGYTALHPDRQTPPKR